MRKIFNNSLFLFIVIGAFIYTSFYLFGERETSDSELITITQGEVDAMVTRWQKTRMRNPTEIELSSMIRAHVREEVLYRKALEMNLDKGDVIIRRRLAQKLDYLTQDIAASINKPSEADLKGFYQSNPLQYSSKITVSFKHIFIDPDKRNNGGVMSSASSLLKKLEAMNGAIETDSLGDRFPLKDYYNDQTRINVQRNFGQEFSRQLFLTPVKKWTGPILSGYGTHLIYIYSIKAPELIPFEEVKGVLEEDWITLKKEEAELKYFNSLLSQYKIIVEGEEKPIDMTENITKSSKQ